MAALTLGAGAALSESASGSRCARGGENERGDELPGRDHACDQLGIPASLMQRRREREDCQWEGRRCWWRWPAGQTWMSEVAEEETGMRGKSCAAETTRRTWSAERARIACTLLRFAALSRLLYQ